LKESIFKIIANLAYHLGLWRLLYALHPIVRRKYLLTVLTFHRVIPKEQSKSFVANYDKGYDNRSYEILLEELSRYFDFINLGSFIEFACGEKKLSRHSLLITFDDADSDFTKYAAPILLENKWPAVIFAPTAYINSNDVFWHLKITNMMHQMDNSTWQILKQRKTLFPEGIQDILDKYNSYEKSRYLPICSFFLNYLDKQRDDEIFAIVDKFVKLTGDSYTLGIQCMGWEDLKSLENRGIRIESHTVSHRKMIHLDDNEALAELKDSKSVIESKLDKRVKAFCYPAGSYNDNVAKLAGEAGYKVAFITHRGKVRYPLEGLDLFKIPRNTIDVSNKIEMNWEIARLLIKDNS
jgi:peptidoglycan/xylan/chitin deacetylase (PgdA/CDA1 family)